MSRKKYIQIQSSNLQEFINLLGDYFGDLNNVPWERVGVEKDFYYTNCYYENDPPGVKLTFSLIVEEKTLTTANSALP